jgi:hypothetical protein
MNKPNWRNTDQFLMPVNKEIPVKGKYDLYPTLRIEDGKIEEGLASLARTIADEKQLIIDGYIGVFFDDFRKKLNAELDKLWKSVNWIDMGEALKSEAEIDQLIGPFLGADDPLFGTRTTLQLIDFFDTEKLQEIKDEGRRQKIYKLFMVAALLWLAGMPNSFTSTCPKTNCSSGRGPNPFATWAHQSRSTGKRCTNAFTLSIGWY